MKTLTEVIREKLETEIALREEINRRSRAEAARIKEAQEMAAKDGLVLIERAAGFRLEGWTCEASHSTTSGGDDYFTVSLVCESGYEGFLHRINFDDGRRVWYLVVSCEEKVSFEIGTMTAYHITTSSGAARSKQFDNLLEALIYARYGDILGLPAAAFCQEAKSLLESLNGRSQ